MDDDIYDKVQENSWMKSKLLVFSNLNPGVDTRPVITGDAGHVAARLRRSAIWCCPLFQKCRSQTCFVWVQRLHTTESDLRNFVNCLGVSGYQLAATVGILLQSQPEWPQVEHQIIKMATALLKLVWLWPQIWKIMAVSEIMIFLCSILGDQRPWMYRLNIFHHTCVAWRWTKCYCNSGVHLWVGWSDGNHVQVSGRGKLHTLDECSNAAWVSV